MTLGVSELLLQSMNCPAECCKRQVLLAGSATLNYASASLAAAWHRHFSLCFLFSGESWRGANPVRVLLSCLPFCVQTAFLPNLCLTCEALDDVFEDISKMCHAVIFDLLDILWHHTSFILSIHTRTYDIIPLKRHGNTLHYGFDTMTFFCFLF